MYLVSTQGYSHFVINGKEALKDFLKKETERVATRRSGLLSYNNVLDMFETPENKVGKYLSELKIYDLSLLKEAAHVNMYDLRKFEYAVVNDEFFKVVKTPILIGWDEYADVIKPNLITTGQTGHLGGFVLNKLGDKWDELSPEEVRQTHLKYHEYTGNKTFKIHTRNRRLRISFDSLGNFRRKATFKTLHSSTLID